MRMLRQCDAQLFSGFQENEGVYDTAQLLALDRCVRKYATYLTLNARLAGSVTFGMQQQLRSQQHQSEHAAFRVVLSGSGTSGRVACLVARSANLFVRHWQHAYGCRETTSPICTYLISGGDKALLRSQER